MSITARRIRRKRHATSTPTRWRHSRDICARKKRALRSHQHRLRLRRREDARPTPKRTRRGRSASMARRNSPAKMALLADFRRASCACASRGSSARTGRASSIRSSNARCGHESVAAIADKIAVPTYTLDAARLASSVSRRIRRRWSAASLQCRRMHLAGIRAVRARLRGGGRRAAESRTVGPLKMADLHAFIAKRPALHRDVHGEVQSASPADARARGRRRSRNTCARTARRGTAGGSALSSRAPPDRDPCARSSASRH